MSENLLLVSPESVLDLTVKGSIGEFVVRTPGSDATRVQYVETHVGFATSGDAQERLLQQLAPVREVFEISELSFNELMQRDIDDARVSEELIPYLLEKNTDALVKLFPPIIVVVLPAGPGGRPESCYPKVSEFTSLDAKHQGVTWSYVRSGEVGAEAFEFRQMVGPDGRLLPHEYGQLRLNTTRVKLAIVDGQHRAMALLALYRNYKEWPKDSRGVEDYYRRWPRSVIEKYDLSGVNLPILLCTFPSLHAGSVKREMTTTEACRSIFLALNKNARPVSKSRNHLLDDGDVIAHFLRDTLSKVKELDSTSKMAIRMWDFELDAEGDKRALSSPMAFSGVIHLYSIIEFLMLNRKNVVKLRHPRQNLWKIRRLDDCIERLQARDELGADRCESANRQMIDRETARILSRRFSERYEGAILQGLDKFAPYAAHCSVAWDVQRRLKGEAFGSTYHGILFEGQSKGRVFQTYVEQLKAHVATQPCVSPEIKAIYNDFEEKQSELSKRVQAFYMARARKWFSKVSANAVNNVYQAIQDVYRNTLTTEAFQIALFVTFFAGVEWLAAEGDAPASDAEVSKWFEDYIESLNQYFRPSSEKECWDIIRAFYGDVTGGYAKPPVAVRSTSCLKRILVPGELKPDEWPKFRYVLLELWKPKEPRLQKYVEHFRHQLRAEAVVAFELQELRHASKRKGIRIDDVPQAEQQKISDEARRTFCKALGALRVKVTPDELKKEVSQDLEEELDEGDDTDE